MFEIFSSKSLMLTFSSQILHLIKNKNEYSIKNIRISYIAKISKYLLKNKLTVMIIDRIMAFKKQFFLIYYSNRI